MATNPRIPRTKESSRTQRILDSMHIIAPGVTHRDGGEVAIQATAIGAINNTIAAILSKLRSLQQTVITLNLQDHSRDDSDAIPLAPPGLRGKQGKEGKRGPAGMDRIGDDLDIPLQLPGPRGPKGDVGATGATGPAGSSSTGGRPSPPPIADIDSSLDIPVVMPGPRGKLGLRGKDGAPCIHADSDFDFPPAVQMPNRKDIIRWPGNTTTFLRGDGTFTAPSVTAAPDPSLQDFRLTLASGYPVYAPPSVGVPASTDTAADTVTFSTAPPWVNGTMVVSTNTSGGLTIWTNYFVHKVSSLVWSFHTTVAAALAGTGPVNLTANVTGSILPTGVSGSTVYFSPYCGNGIALYTGTGSIWELITSAEVNIALGTLTANLPYDVYAYNVAGVLTLELVAWTSDSVRATAIVRQDGIYCKTGTLTKRYVGTIRTDSTTTCIMDYGGLVNNVGGKWFVWNADNRVRTAINVHDQTANWTYSTNAWRQARGNAGNQVETIVGFEAESLSVMACVGIQTSGSSTQGVIGIGLNATTTANITGYRSQSVSTGGDQDTITAHLEQTLTAGYVAITWLETSSNGTITVTWTGYAPITTNGYSGLIASFFA